MPQLRRVPALTLAVVAVTAVTSAIAVSSPTVLAHLQRTPAGLHGDWWRTFTSLFMQSSAAGAASNLFFTLVLGVVAEQIASRWRWLVCYFGAGIVGELVAYSWQPVGAGNSVAVCGLAGLIALACWRRDARLQAGGWRYAGEFAVVVTVASGVFLACVRDIHGAALLAGVALAAVVCGAAREPLRARSEESARSAPTI